MDKRISLIWIIICVVCQFCQKDFEVLGRHAWRCKERNQRDEIVSNDNLSNPSLEQADLQNCSPTNSKTIRCVCGKVVKTYGGLKRHQRSCRAITGLNTNVLIDIAQEIEESMSPNDNSTEFVASNNLGDTIVRPGIHLPKSETQWKTANLFFQVSLRLHEVSNGLNAACKKLSITI